MSPELCRWKELDSKLSPSVSPLASLYSLFSDQSRFLLGFSDFCPSRKSWDCIKNTHPAWGSASPSDFRPILPASQASGRGQSSLCVCYRPSLPCHLVYSLVCDTDGDYVIILLWGPWHICRARAHLLCCAGKRPTPQMLH